MQASRQTAAICESTLPSPHSPFHFDSPESRELPACLLLLLTQCGCFAASLISGRGAMEAWATRERPRARWEGITGRNHQWVETYYPLAATSGDILGFRFSGANAMFVPVEQFRLCW